MTRALILAFACLATAAVADDELASQGKAAPMFRLPVYNKVQAPDFFVAKYG